jgi:hypothetical protein
VWISLKGEGGSEIQGDKGEVERGRGENELRGGVVSRERTKREWKESEKKEK